MRDEQSGGDESANTRQRRLDALHGLASQETEQHTSEAVMPRVAKVTLTPNTPQSAPTLGRLGGGASPQRTTAALFIVAVLLVFGVVFGVVFGPIVQHSGLALGPLGAKPAPALVGKAFSLQGAGTLVCPSSPVWSPDGKQLAVVALAQAAPDGCRLWNDVTNIQRSDSGGNSGVVTTNGPPPDTFAVVIMDAATGHIARVIKLPELSPSLLCTNAVPCGLNPESVGWSPDGRSVAAFFTYIYYDNDQIHYQARGALIVASVDGSRPPRMLIAKGRIRATSPTNNISPDELYSPPRFTWDLSTGTATYADIHRGAYLFTVLFAPGYRLGTDGTLTLDQRTQPGDDSPWRAGVLIPNGPQGASPSISYQASQWLWSSDSRYALPNLDAGVYVTIAGVTSVPPAGNLGIVEEAAMAAPDAATAQAIKVSARTSSVAALARNPDGALLAALNCSPSGASLLAIRSVATGKTLAQASYTYPLTSTSLGCAGDLSPIAWSPDGAHIAAADSPDGQIIVWQVNVHS